MRGFRAVCVRVFERLCIRRANTVAAKVTYAAHLQALSPKQVASLPPFLRWTQQAFGAA